MARAFQYIQRFTLSFLLAGSVCFLIFGAISFGNDLNVATLAYAAESDADGGETGDIRRRGGATREWDGGEGGNVVIQNPLKATSLEGFVVLLLNIVVDIGSILAVIFLIYSGFLFVVAQGNEVKLTRAKQAFLWTVIGIFVLLGARAISGIICGSIDQLRDTPAGCPSF